MVQPSYPKTIELEHVNPRSKSNSKGTPQETGADMASTDMTVDDMAPSDAAPPESHANLSDDRQAERPDTEAVNAGSVIRKEKDPGPGLPH